MDRLTRQMERFAILLVVGFAFGCLGPYGTYTGLGLVERFVFWMTAIPLIGLLSVPAVRAVAQTVPSLPVPIRVLVGAMIVGVPGTLVTVALRSLFPDAPPMPPPELPRLYFYVTLVIALVGIPINMMNLMRERRPEGASTRIRPMAAPEVPRTSLLASPFLRRIPAKLGSELLCIATEDHYLRVTTTIGSDLILFRLSDAIAELDPVAGQQVHRSYWVARDAVASIERNGHRTALVLVNGAQIPVSRTYLQNLRDAGWFALPPPQPLAALSPQPPAAQP